jgi:enamine deaminase RidA (YjgF/YER057c/UK114 family)
MSVETRLRELGIELGDARSPAGNYVGAVTTGNLVFLAGNGPDRPGLDQVRGKVGGEVSAEQGREQARQVGLNALAALKQEIGDLDRVRRVVKVLGMVNAAPDFTQHPAVIDGFSDLMVEVFGDKGRGARSAVGMGSLPFQIPVEVEMIVEIE